MNRSAGENMALRREAIDWSVQPVSRGTLRQQVTSRLMTGIFQGRFRSGQRLVVQDLATAYQASPTPVREALVELASLGLVDLLPNRGAVVQPFGPQEIREISHLRRLLEVEAARGAAGRIPADQLGSLQEELLRLAAPPRDETWDQSARDIDTRLHGLIAENCGSRRLGAEVGRYLTLFRALRDVSHQRDAWTNYSRSNDVPEHLAIVEALAASDAEGAAQAMDRHIRSAAMALEEIIFSSPDAPGPDREGAGVDGVPAPSPAAGSSELKDNGPGVPEGRTAHQSKRSPRS
jgi:DNA-binding GntR family transcriptional regulator